MWKAGFCVAGIRHGARSFLELLGFTGRRVGSTERINERRGLCSESSQLSVEISFYVDLQKAWEQSRLDHLFERFGKPLIVILGQKNNPPKIQRCGFRTAGCVLDVKQGLVITGVKMLAPIVRHFRTAEK